jgi:hypothetical protein
MRWLVVVSVLIGIAWLSLAPRRSPYAAGTDDAAAAIPLRWQGAASCASSACHGGNGAKGSKRSEYSTWIEHDAHARAYSVLLNSRAQQIARNLQLREPAHKSAVCLPCHAAPAPDHARDDRFQISDGVSCETCHGMAEKWLAEHYLPNWKTKSASEKEALGFRPTKNLLARARACVVCHVGHDDADVNHDLIAAGHPRLLFEYSSYLAAIPKHWSEQDERKRYPDFHARAWMIGQLTTAGAALDLLAHRSQRVWPEFAEYDCRACHHDLTGKAPRARSSAEVGLLVWSDWHPALLPQAIAIANAKYAEPIASALRDLRAEMQKPVPSADRVRSTERRTKEAFRHGTDALEREATLEPNRLRNSFLQLCDEFGKTRRGSEGALQYLFALRALHQTLDDLGTKDGAHSWRLPVYPGELPAGFDKPMPTWRLPE